jgi:methylenetetrahydrofolate dehydrogenase (NADP+)/methenyltetrahydrofolate cyclohydrolase
MTAQLIDGRARAEHLKAEVSREVKQLTADGIGCGLATVIVGEDYRAGAYEGRLARLAAELGVPHRRLVLPPTITQADLLAQVHRLNDDPLVTGILVLRPLPAHIAEAEVFRSLSPVKDIEAVHPENAGLLALGTPRYVPSTAASVFHVLDEWLDSVGEDRPDFYHRSLVVVVGRSNNVGKPAVSLAYQRGAAVESVDEWVSRTGRLGWHTRRADVLIVAAGVPGLIRSEHVRAGAVVLDVGINPVRDPNTGAVRMVGDVDTEDVLPRARAVTPVPGGIGPVTDVWLLRNTVAAARNATDGPLSSISAEEEWSRP